MALDFPNSPTNGQTYTANNITWEYETSSTTWKVKQDGTAGKTRVATVKDLKGNRVGGGQITQNTWTTRDLNTISDPHNIGISVSTNVITIPAGTYRITWRAPGWRIYTFQTKLEYSTDSGFGSGVSKVLGSSEFSSSQDDSKISQSSSEGLAPSLTFSETTYVRIRQWAGVTGPAFGNGLGVATYNDVADTESGEDTVYTTVQIEDLATTVKDNATYVEGTSRTAVVKDQKNKGVQGGDFGDNAWRDRDLTVEDDPFNFVTLYPTTNGQTTPSPGNTPGYFSLPAGKYQITFTAVAHDVGRNVAAMLWSSTQSNINKTYATTDSRDGEFYGTSMACAGASTLSKGSEVVEITETSFFKVIHYCKSTNMGSGFGQAVDIGTDDKETYLIIEIEDLATAVKDNATYVEGKSKVATLQHQETQNTDAGGFTAGAWHLRELTTESDPNNFVTFPVTGDSDPYSDWKLSAGSYRIRWSAPGYRVNAHQTRLAYDDNSSFTSPTYVMGSSEDSPAVADESQTRSVGEALLTLTDTTWLRIEHRCGTTNGTNGQGHASNFATEVYTEVSIEDLATAVKNSESINSSTNVWHVEKSDSQLIHTNPIAWTDITGLSQTVTSTSSSTKFLITATVNASIVGTGSDGVVRLMRGTTVIGSTSSDGNAVSTKTGFGHVSGQNSQYQSDALCITYLDTPGVGTHTYHIEGINSDASIGMRINRRGLNEDFYLTSHMSIQRYT